MVVVAVALPVAGRKYWQTQRPETQTQTQTQTRRSRGRSDLDALLLLVTSRPQSVPRRKNTMARHPSSLYTPRKLHTSTLAHSLALLQHMHRLVDAPPSSIATFALGELPGLCAATPRSKL